MQNIVIIGTGLAGYMVAKEFRKLNTTDQLTMITKDGGCFYSKPLLSTSLTQNKTPGQLCVNDVSTMQAQLNAVIHTYTQVLRLFPEDKKIIYKDNKGAEKEIFYDRLVLANGAEKVHAPLTGDAVCDVLSVNNLADYDAFRAQLSDKKRIAILGAGLVGCEFANDLLNTGYTVSLIAPDKYPLQSLVPDKVGVTLQKVFAEKGVQWHLSCFALAVDKVDDEYQVTLSNGEKVEVDLVLSAVGIRPDTTLAKNAGLMVNRGVVVNTQLQTSDPNVYALGDCAEVAGALKMYVAPILHAAKILAQVLAGADATLQYPIMPIVIKTTNCPVALVMPESCDIVWEFEESGESVKALCRDKNGNLVGFALSGNFVKDRMPLIKQMVGGQ